MVERVNNNENRLEYYRMTHTAIKNYLLDYRILIGQILELELKLNFLIVS